MAFPVVNWSDRAASATVDGGTTVTATEPTGAASGDLLLLFFASDGAQVTPTVDAFWTEIRLGDATGAWGGVWFGIRGASAPDYQISWSGNEDASATAVHVDAGTFDSTTPVDLAEDVFNTNTVSPVDAGPMAMTGTKDRTIIAFGFGDGTGASTGTDSGGFTTPVLSNWTEEWDESFTAGGGQARFWADDVEYTGTDAALRKTRADDEWGTIIFAIEPDAGGPKTGTASGTGSGTGAATGLPTHKGTATGTGSGTGAATGVPTHKGTATGTGSGAGSATGANAGTASGTGSGTGTATGLPTHKGTATGTGSGTGAATGANAGTAAGTGSGLGAATGNKVGGPKVGTASGTGSGTGAATGANAGTASGTGSGTGAATGLPTHKGTATGTGSGTGAATGANAGTASGTGSGTGAATGVKVTLKTGTASGTGSGTGAATGLPTHKGTATGTGSGTGAATGLPTHKGTGSGTGSGAGAATGQLAGVVKTGTASGSGSGTGSAFAKIPDIPPMSFRSIFQFKTPGIRTTSISKRIR